MGSSLRRRRPQLVGGVATPRPQPFLFSFLFLFSVLLFAPMWDSRTVWLSVARQCGAAGLRLVTWFHLFAVAAGFFFFVRSYIGFHRCGFTGLCLELCTLAFLFFVIAFPVVSLASPEFARCLHYSCLRSSVPPFSYHFV